MNYAESGSLRHNLNNIFNSMDWNDKLSILRQIMCGLNQIHDNKLIHHDFHCGNILNCYGNRTYITDLGLCQPANEKPSQNDEKNIYGVLPYVAPEVLRGKTYTQASDVYGFGIIIYEVFNGLPPYHDMAHEDLLALKICQGFRPKFNIKVPQLIEDIAKKCVDADPLKRPTAEYLKETFEQWYLDVLDENSEIRKQINEADEFNKKQPSFTKSPINTEFTYTTHPQAIYTSRLLNFNNLPEPKNADNTHDGYSEEEYSGN